MKTFNELRTTSNDAAKTQKTVQDIIESFRVDESDYTDPETFEDVPGIDVSLSDMRKKVIVRIGESQVELTKEQAEEIADAISVAVSRM